MNKKLVVTTLSLSLSLASLSTYANSLQDPSFEAAVTQGQQLSWSSADYGSWGVGDGFIASSSGSAGINALSGSKMLHFNGGGSYGDIYQIIDLSGIASKIDAGLVHVEFGAAFNSTAANNVGVRLLGWNSAPTSFSGYNILGGNNLNSLTTDSDTQTWQYTSFDIPLASGMHYLALGIHAKNGIATFADNAFVDLKISSVPVPAAVWLFGSAFLGLVAYRKKRASLQS